MCLETRHTLAIFELHVVPAWCASIVSWAQWFVGADAPQLPAGLGYISIYPEPKVPTFTFWHKSLVFEHFQNQRYLPLHARYPNKWSEVKTKGTYLYISAYQNDQILEPKVPTFTFQHFKWSEVRSEVGGELKGLAAPPPTFYISLSTHVNLITRRVHSDGYSSSKCM